MYETVIEKIDAYNTIVIHRHIQPDLDALGSQLGLKRLIEKNFPKKEVYAVGEEGDLGFLGQMDTIDDATYNDALVIVLDVAVSDRVSDSRFRLGAEKLVIDHHKNASDFADVFVHQPKHIATAQIITDMCMRYDLFVDAETATRLYAGLVTDSGRFKYPATNELTFKAAAYLYERGARIQEVYNQLYDEAMNYKKLKGYFINHFQTTPNNVAYMKNDKTLKDTYGVSTFTISRGMVNQMGDINGVPFWVNFTEDEDGRILCELRSKSIPVVDIAKKYGGGGHDLACGCTLESWEKTDELLQELDARAERIA